MKKCQHCDGKGKITYGPETISGQKEISCFHRFIRVGSYLVQLEKVEGKKSVDTASVIILAASAVAFVVYCLLGWL